MSCIINNRKRQLIEIFKSSNDFLINRPYVFCILLPLSNVLPAQWIYYILDLCCTANQIQISIVEQNIEIRLIQQILKTRLKGYSNISYKIFVDSIIAILEWRYERRNAIPLSKSRKLIKEIVCIIVSVFSVNLEVIARNATVGTQRTFASCIVCDLVSDIRREPDIILIVRLECC